MAGGWSTSPVRRDLGNGTSSAGRRDDFGGPNSSLTVAMGRLSRQ